MSDSSVGIEFVRGDTGERLAEAWSTVVPRVGDVYVHDYVDPLAVVRVEWRLRGGQRGTPPLTAVVVVQPAGPRAGEGIEVGVVVHQAGAARQSIASRHGPVEVECVEVRVWAPSDRAIDLMNAVGRDATLRWSRS